MRLSGPLLPLVSQAPEDAIEMATQLLAEEPGLAFGEVVKALEGFYLSPVITDCIHMMVNAPADG